MPTENTWLLFFVLSIKYNVCIQFALCFSTLPCNLLALLKFRTGYIVAFLIITTFQKKAAHACSWRKKTAPFCTNSKCCESNDSKNPSGTCLNFVRWGIIYRNCVDRLAQRRYTLRFWIKFSIACKFRSKVLASRIKLDN